MNIEEKVKANLLVRGFDNKTQLNNRGLIGATIDETILEVVKNLRIADVSKCEGLQGEALLLAYGKFLSEECSLISPDMENHEPYIRKFLSQQ